MNSGKALRVPIYGKQGYRDIDPEATKGATVGKDLYNADGTLLDLDKLQSGTPAPAVNLSGYATGADLAAEAAARAAADTAEAITRASADSTLTAAIASEASTRATADTTEAAARVAGDAASVATAAADATTKANAAKAYADTLVVGLVDDRGNFDASVNAYPSSGGSGTAGAILKGDLWTVSVGGTLPTGIVVTAGDLVRALIDTPGNTQANWAVTENNIGYVAENASNKVTSLSGASTDTQYPSAKLAYDQLALKRDTALASGYLWVGNGSGQSAAVLMSGDGTLSNTGVFTLATAQSAAHTWAATQTFSVAPVFTDASGTRTALGLGTVATLASDIDGTLAANSDTRVATQKAVKTYVTAAVAGAGGSDNDAQLMAVMGL